MRLEKYLRTVEISDVCPVCGSPRAQLVEMVPIHEDGCTVLVSRWRNPCGHVDKYRGVLQEARERNVTCHQAVT